MFTCLGPRPGPESGGWGLLPMVAYAGKLRSKGKPLSVWHLHKLGSSC